MSLTSLLILGYGYSAAAVASTLLSQGWQVAGTTRDRAKAARMEAEGVVPILLGDGSAARDRDVLAQALGKADSLLASAAPETEGDPFVLRFGETLRAAGAALRWVGYFSTTGVYGDRAGGWVDEASAPLSDSDTARKRLLAESQWRDLAAELAARCLVFRLSGIYGPERNALVQLRAGTARRMVKEGQVFNRIHVADIAGAVAAALRSPDAEGIFNVSDDLPATQDAVVVEAARLLDIAPPPAVPYDPAQMSPMGRKFWSESRRVGNERLSRDLGYRLRYPTYREGLAALAKGAAA